jgi:hypothetical protein
LRELKALGDTVRLSPELLLYRRAAHPQRQVASRAEQRDLYHRGESLTNKRPQHDSVAVEWKIASGGALAEGQDAGDGNDEANCHRGNGQIRQIRVGAAPDLEEQVQIFGLQLPGHERDIHERRRGAATGLLLRTLDEARYRQQIEGDYADIAEVPPDPYDIAAPLAHRLMGYYNLALNSQERAAYD